MYRLLFPYHNQASIAAVSIRTGRARACEIRIVQAKRDPVMSRMNQYRFCPFPGLPKSRQTCKKTSVPVTGISIMRMGMLWAWWFPPRASEETAAWQKHVTQCE